MVTQLANANSVYEFGFLKPKTQQSKFFTFSLFHITYVQKSNNILTNKNGKNDISIINEVPIDLTLLWFWLLLLLLFKDFGNL